MSAAFHRGLTQALRTRLQTAGIRIEESDAQRALAGATVVAGNSPAQDTVRNIAESVWLDRFHTMSQWENDHPGESPFPPIFVEVVLHTLRAGLASDEDPGTLITQVIKLAEAELEL